MCIRDRIWRTQSNDGSNPAVCQFLPVANQEWHIHRLSLIHIYTVTLTDALSELYLFFDSYEVFATDFLQILVKRSALSVSDTFGNLQLSHSQMCIRDSSGTATLLRLSPNYQFYPRTLLAVTYFRYPRLSWLDGRCVHCLLYTSTINMATLCRFVELARILYAPYAWFLPSKIS